MAYMNQAKKAVIAAALKQVVPKDWKYSLRVSNHSAICMHVSAAPVRLEDLTTNEYDLTVGSTELNPYHFRKYVTNEDLADTLGKIIAALNTGNHDNSDIMTDYFDVGHYVHLQFGAWNKPFVNTAQRQFI